MAKFAFKPALTIRGRESHGLRGWSGKPSHPPLTHVPIASYVLAAAFDVVSALSKNQQWARDFFVAATFLIVVGLASSLPAMLTGAADRLTLTRPGTQVRRTVNTHALAVVVVTVCAIADLVIRLRGYGDQTHPSLMVLGLSILVAAAVVVGAMYGGSLVYDFGCNVNVNSDEPAWRVTETGDLSQACIPVDEIMSRSEWLADSEVAVTRNTPDPLDRSAG